jgi:hypothetical protein
VVAGGAGAGVTTQPVRASSPSGSRYEQRIAGLLIQ